MPHRVVVIDDERGLADALSIRLNAAGVAAQPAYGGTAGLAAVRAVHPDAIVLDMRMPDMDGSEVHAAMRGDPTLSSIPVIFLSANVQDSARHSALASGAFAYLTKPYDAREVVSTVLEAIASVNRKGRDSHGS
jgi:DNA-binding response OmpR family regulator